jgi:hypothetical protein
VPVQFDKQHDMRMLPAGSVSRRGTKPPSEADPTGGGVRKDKVPSPLPLARDSHVPPRHVRAFARLSDGADGAWGMRDGAAATTERPLRPLHQGGGAGACGRGRVRAALAILGGTYEAAGECEFLRVGGYHVVVVDVAMRWQNPKELDCGRFGPVWPRIALRLLATCC